MASACAGQKFICIGGAFEQFVLCYSHNPTPTVDACGVVCEYPDPPTYINDATITYAVKDSAGATVSGGTGTLSYVTGSNGDYKGTIPDSVTSLLTENALYDVVITARESGVIILVYYFRYRARKRGH